MIFAILSHLLQFSAADISGTFRFIQPLDKFLVTYNPRRLGEKLQFIQVFINFPFVFTAFDDADEYGCFLFFFFQSFVFHMFVLTKKRLALTVSLISCFLFLIGAGR